MIEVVPLLHHSLCEHILGRIMEKGAQISSKFGVFGVTSMPSGPGHMEKCRIIVNENDSSSCVLYFGIPHWCVGVIIVWSEWHQRLKCAPRKMAFLQLQGWSLIITCLDP